MATPFDRVDVAIRQKTAYVRVFGRGTFKMGPSLKDFGMAAIQRGCVDIHVEMSECTGMDSTFMGTLAGLAAQVRKQQGAVTLFHANEKNKGLIRMLGLRELVRIEESATGAEKMPVIAETLIAETGKKELTAAMVDAHEALVELAPENIVKFKDVLSFLREDLKDGAVQSKQPAS